VSVSAENGRVCARQSNRDAESRISDTRVLCVVVATQRGITVLVAVETRARPVHSWVRPEGARKPARDTALLWLIELRITLCMTFASDIRKSKKSHHRCYEKFFSLKSCAGAVCAHEFIQHRDATPCNEANMFEAIVNAIELNCG
jgi:hypothetical protein